MFLSVKFQNGVGNVFFNLKIPKLKKIEFLTFLTNFLNCSSLFFIFSLCSIFLNTLVRFLPSMKIQKATQIQDGRQDVFIVSNLQI
jgi:hypothetical protein